MEDSKSIMDNYFSIVKLRGRIDSENTQNQSLNAKLELANIQNRSLAIQLDSVNTEFTRYQKMSATNLDLANSQCAKYQDQSTVQTVKLGLVIKLLKEAMRESHSVSQGVTLDVATRLLNEVMQCN